MPAGEPDPDIFITLEVLNGDTSVGLYCNPGWGQYADVNANYPQPGYAVWQSGATPCLPPGLERQSSHAVGAIIAAMLMQASVCVQPNCAVSQPVGIPLSPVCKTVHNLLKLCELCVSSHRRAISCEHACTGAWVMWQPAMVMWNPSSCRL